MLLPNHVLGGFVFSGIVGGIMGDNLFQNPAAIVTVLIGSILPDIDMPTSPVGWVFKPLSNWIYARYGHRTITHSIFALIGTTLIFKLCFGVLGFHALFWVIAYFSHCLFDMLTIQGVPFLFPLKKNKWVLPPDPELRFNTGDGRAESITFASFLVLGLTLQPLMTNGFWTTYNSAFGTQKHLSSEFQKSKDLLEVSYVYEIGSKQFVGSGYCIEASENKTILREKDNWTILDPSVFKIKSVLFKHTGRTFFIEPQTFINVSADSLNLIVANRAITEIEIQSNVTAKINEKGFVGDMRNFKKTYPSVLAFFASDSAFKSEPFNFVPSIAAKLKASEIGTIKAKYEHEKRLHELKMSELENLIKQPVSNNALEHEHQMRRIAELKNEVKNPPLLDQIHIQQIEYEMRVGEQQEVLTHDLARREHELKQLEKARQIQKTVFSGFLKSLIIK
jgi:inner membrane protein